MKRLLVLLALTLSTQAFAQKTIFENKTIAVSKGISLLPYEIHLRSLLREITTFFSKSKDIQVKIVNSDLALEFQVFYSPEDHTRLHFMSGLRLRAIRTLFNELSISAQQTNSELSSSKFDYYQRKIHIISFHNKGLN